MAAAIPLTSGPALANPAEAKPQLMFVQTAEDMKADDKTLRLINVGNQTLYWTGARPGLHPSKLGFLDREAIRMVPKLAILEMGLHLKEQKTTNGWLYFTKVWATSAPTI